MTDVIYCVIFAFLALAVINAFVMAVTGCLLIYHMVKDGKSGLPTYIDPSKCPDKK